MFHSCSIVVPWLPTHPPISPRPHPTTPPISLTHSHYHPPHHHTPSPSLPLISEGVLSNIPTGCFAGQLNDHEHIYRPGKNKRSSVSGPKPSLPRCPLRSMLRLGVWWHRPSGKNKRSILRGVSLCAFSTLILGVSKGVCDVCGLVSPSSVYFSRAGIGNHSLPSGRVA